LLGCVACAHGVQLPARAICEPHPAMGTFCIYRNNFEWTQPLATVLIDGVEVVTLENDEWVEITVPPGLHSLRIDAPPANGPLTSRELDLHAGEVIYVHTVVAMVRSFLQKELTVAFGTVDEALAHREIKSDCRAGPRLHFAQ
jgi:hypothetical protein